MSMETERVTNKDMKIQIPSGSEFMSSGVEFQGTNYNLAQQGSSTSGLIRPPIMNKGNNCLCSPTKHAGSFRCRLHRAPSLQRTKSMKASAVEATGDANKDQRH